MNLFSMLFLVSSLIGVFMGCFVYFQGTKKPLHNIFMAMCQFGSWMSFVQFMTLQSGDPKTALFWTRSMVLGFFLPPVLLRFGSSHSFRLGPRAHLCVNAYCDAGFKANRK